MLLLWYSVDCFCCNILQGQNPQSDESIVTITFLPASATNFPSFAASQRSFRFYEDTPKQTTVTSVLATSSKPGVAITYRIAGGNHNSAFEVDRESGLIRTKRGLDYENVQNYNLWVEAVDSSDPPLAAYIALNIDIRDRNDNVPKFVSTYYNASIAEGEQPGQVLTVEAVDGDSGDNGRVTYRIADGNVGEAFNLDPNNGRIRSNVVLDRERVLSYSLLVVATDHVSTGELVLKDHPIGYKKYGLSRQVVFGYRFIYTET